MGFSEKIGPTQPTSLMYHHTFFLLNDYEQDPPFSDIRYSPFWSVEGPLRNLSSRLFWRLSSIDSAIYTCIHLQSFTHMSMSIYIYTHLDMYNIYIYTYVHIYISTHLSLYLSTVNISLEVDPRSAKKCWRSRTPPWRREADNGPPKKWWVSWGIWGGDLEMNRDFMAFLHSLKGGFSANGGFLGGFRVTNQRARRIVDNLAWLTKSWRF